NGDTTLPGDTVTHVCVGRLGDLPVTASVYSLLFALLLSPSPPSFPSSPSSPSPSPPSSPSFPSSESSSSLGGVSLGLDGPSLVSGMLSPPLSSSPSGGPWGPSGASWSPSCCGGGAGTQVSVSCGTVVVGGAVDVSGVDFVVLDVVLLLVLAGTGGWSASP